MKLATATKAAATSVTTTRPRGTDEEKSSLAGDDEGEGANPAAAGSAGTARFRRMANTTRCAPPSPPSSPPCSPTSHG